MKKIDIIVYINYFKKKVLTMIIRFFQNKQKQLMKAIEQNDYLVVKKLISHPLVSIHAKEHKNEKTPLHRAAEFGCLEICELLIQHGADVNAADTEGWTPLYWAAWNGYDDIFELLISCDKDTKNTMLQSLAKYPHHKFRKKHTKICKRLIEEYGADVNTKLQDEDFVYTPLCSAAYQGHVEVCESLIKFGADVNIKGTWDWAPLHEISANKNNSKRHIKICKLLIQYGGNVNAEDDMERTPLHLAAMKGYFEIFDLLIEYGADVNVMDIEGQTPLDIRKS